MSQKTQGFHRVGMFKRGYSVDEVDRFVAHAKRAYEGKSAPMDVGEIRNAAFSAERRGYNPHEVDAALDRLEAAFIKLDRASVIEDKGEDTWLNRTYDLATTLYPRLLRPAGKRFADADGEGYLKKDVDALLDRLSKYFDGNASLTSADLRTALFHRAKEADAYDESTVDVFLERAVSVLTAVE